jgi:acetyl esterase
MPVDPQVQELLRQEAALGVPPLHQLTPEAARRAARLPETLAPLPQLANVTEKSISGPAGALRLRIYTPIGNGPFPALLYIHGGGWVLCDLNTHDRDCRVLAWSARSVVVAVEYRLAPENPFPAGVEDCMSTLRWLSANAGAIDADPRRIAVGGDSAGGNLSAVLALQTREVGDLPLIGQMLIYPVTDYYEPGTQSYREFAEGYGLTRDEMIWFWHHYLPDPDQAKNPLTCPLRAGDLRGLPPAFVITAEYDVLRDEGERYAELMQSAGVPTTLRRYQGMNHGFCNNSDRLDEGKNALVAAGEWLQNL